MSAQMDFYDDIEKLCMGCLGSMEESGGICEHCGFNNGAPVYPHQLPPMTVLAGKYLTGRVLGEGGFGITYLGIDMNLGLKVAIKEYYPAGFVSRTSQSATVAPYSGTNGEYFTAGLDKFLAEARALARFHDLESIVEVRDFFRENGTAYIIMEFIEGMTLSQALEKQNGRMASDYVFNLMEPVILALQQVHKSGLIHRDISPDNIMLDEKGRMKLLDFGAARQFDSRKTMSVMLKPGYAPIEQYQTSGHFGPWSDVYALCATIYKLITGAMPIESLERLVEDTLAPPSLLGADIDPGREAVLMQGLAVRKEERFSNMSALHSAFYSSRGQAPRQAPLEAPAEAPKVFPGAVEGAEEIRDNKQPASRKKPTLPRGRLALILSGVLALCGAAALLFALWHNGGNNPPYIAIPTPSAILLGTAQPSQSPQETAAVQGLSFPDAGVFAGVYGNSSQADNGVFYYYEMDSITASNYLEYIQSLDRRISLRQGEDTSHFIVLYASDMIGGARVSVAEMRLLQEGMLEVFVPSGTDMSFAEPAVTQSYLSQNGISAAQWLGLPEGYSYGGKNYRGNTAANYRNNAVMVKQGRWVYFSDLNSGGDLIAFDMDDESHVVLTDGFERVTGISALGEWIYFSAYEKGSVQPGLYKVHADGLEEPHLIAESLMCVAVYGDFIFAMDTETNGGLIRIHRDDENSVIELLPANGVFTNVAYDRIYQCDVGGKTGIFSMNMDGSGLTLISRQDVHEMIIHGGWIYYITPPEEGSEIWRMSLDGIENELVDQGPALNMAVDDQSIYFTGYDDSALYGLYLDGSGPERLAESCAAPVLISDDNYIYLFYMDTDGRLMMYNFSQESSVEFGLN